MRALAILALVLVPVRALAQAAPHASDDDVISTTPTTTDSPSAWDAWAVSAGASIVVHANTGGVLVPMPGASLSISRQIVPWLGVRAAYRFQLSRRGVAGTFSLELHHYASVQLFARHRVHERCALWLGAGAALVVQQNQYRAPSNEVWVARFAPAVALSGGVDVTLPGFGVRFSIDAYLHPDFVDAGGGVHALVPFA